MVRVDYLHRCPEVELRAFCGGKPEDMSLTEQFLRRRQATGESYTGAM